MAVGHLNSCVHVLFLLCFIGKLNGSFFVTEEQASNKFVGNIIDSDNFPREITRNDLKGFKCSFLTGGNSFSNYFSLDEVSGAVYTATSLDRETICPDGGVCVVTLDVAVSTDTVPVKIFRVDVVINDENDNSPVFPETEIHLDVMENAEINAEFSIPAATDLDRGDNSVKMYSLEPESDTFGIIVTETLEGLPGAALVLRRKLDRESVASYEVRVLAKDGGSPQRVGVMSVVISVLDVNDHAPVFPKQVTSITIRENSPTGSPVLKMTASDPDTDMNGEVRYRFSPRSTILALGVFEINSTTGEMVLISNLDYEMTRDYRLIVEAYDGGSPSRSSQVLVTVNVTDVNDNAPVLNVNYLSGQSYAEISESATVDSFVAHISVTDKDSGTNAVADCSFDHSDFKIEELRQNKYQVSVKGKLDRERVDRYELEVTCQDRGAPVSRSSGDIIIHITDDNDNAPVFQQHIFPVIVEESLNVGKPIMTLKAQDPDEGPNARITYEIVSSEPETDFFQIYSETGTIFVANQLDREAQEEIRLVVAARDHGIPPRRTRTTVDVQILDVNDEFPLFEPKNYHFDLVENSPMGTFIGKVEASDSDTGLGGQVEFSLPGGSLMSFLFTIGSDSGEIRTKQMLDREENPIIPLHVIARDKGTPTLSSTALVNIRVIDLNDNVPTFLFPSAANETITLNKYMNSKPFKVVATVNATDPDLDTVLVYYLQTETDGLFIMNSSSGEITTTRSLEKLEDGTVFQLNVSVADSGTPLLWSTSILNLVIASPVASDTISSSTNMYIVVIVLSLTLVISLTVAVVIVCIRKRDFTSKGPAKQEPSRRGDNRVTLSPKQVNFSANPSRRHPYVIQDGVTIEPRSPRTENQQNNQIYAFQTQASGTDDHHTNHPDVYPGHSNSNLRSPRQTWLTDSPNCYQVNSNPTAGRVERSLSDVSEGTFDSGKGGSNNSLDDRVKGANSSGKDVKFYPCPTESPGEEFVQMHTLSSSGEVFTKKANSPWKRQEGFEPGLLKATAHSSVFEADMNTDQQSYYSTHTFNGQSVFV